MENILTATSFSSRLRTARGQAIITDIDTGSGPGSLLFYTAPQPTIGGAAITTQTLLGTVTFSRPAGTVVAGVVNFATINDDALADNTGIADWVRVLDGDGVWVMDIKASDNSGTGPVKMPSTQIYAGGIVHFASLIITEGNV